MPGVGKQRQRINEPAADSFRQHIRKRQAERYLQARQLARAAPLVFVMMSVMRADNFFLY
jgi:hypothetical protein